MGLLGQSVWTILTVLLIVYLCAECFGTGGCASQCVSIASRLSTSFISFRWIEQRLVALALVLVMATAAIIGYCVRSAYFQAAHVASR